MLVPTPAVSESDDGTNAVGAFTAPFAEPTIGGEPHGEHCIEREDGTLDCKPTAVSLVVLDDGRVLYWNGVEATENIELGIAAELGRVSVNDQSRLLEIDFEDPDSSTWSQPEPVDGGANPDGYDADPLFPAPFNDADEMTHNDGALFCADQVFLADGRVLTVGGTAYYNDPHIPGTDYGVAELEGLRNARIFDPETNTWDQAGDMQFGRWYPTLVTLADGRVLAASGVTRLMKPVYPDRDLEDSFRNVAQMEYFDPQTGEWSYAGEDADRSLPLYPRLHLLPNGHVYYNAAGQAFNPSGYGHDQVFWNMAATLDPEAGSWTDLGLAGLGTTHPGFRGSAFSIMLPLQPDDEGAYTRAEFLAAGGVLLTPPGSYIATDQSAITTVDVDGDEVSGFETRETGRLNEPRWYSTGVLLPDGSVMAFSGADRDEVVAPGTGFPETRAERFDPVTETWEPMATGERDRTYHNTAALMPDGSVLVGGHAPIPTLYGSHETLPGGFSENEGRDPTFELYRPPYFFSDNRPEITTAPTQIEPGETFTITTADAADVERVLLIAHTSVTHLVDGDQRAVELQILAQEGDELTLSAPPSNAVAPAGPYMLFISTEDGDGSLLPSMGAAMKVAQAD